MDGGSGTDVKTVGTTVSYFSSRFIVKFPKFWRTDPILIRLIVPQLEQRTVSTTPEWLLEVDGLGQNVRECGHGSRNKVVVSRS